MKCLFCIAEPETEAMHLGQPVEVLYTGTILQQMGHKVEVQDLRVSSLSQQNEVDQAPDLIFFLTQTYDRSQCFSLSLNKAQQALAQLRHYWQHVPIVTIGVHGSIEGQLTLKKLATDFVLPGEIEAAVPWFVDKFLTDPSILHQQLPQDEVPQQVDPALLPVPNYDLIDTSKYLEGIVDAETGKVHFGKAGLIFANRGCPYACSYCFVWFGKKMRYRPVPLVIEELKQQATRGVTHFFFLDYTFTLNKTWVKELCQEIITTGLNITWMCQTRCEQVNGELLRAMRQAGCVGIYYGVESPWIDQAGLQKPIPQAVIDKTIQETNATNIRCFLFILLGLENKNPETAQMLVDWLARTPAIFSARAILPRPHTTLWRQHSQISNFTSWEELFTASRDIGNSSYWYPEIEEVEKKLLQLPNNVLNQPVVTSDV